jgi:hypothetical protein
VKRNKIIDKQHTNKRINQPENEQRNEHTSRPSIQDSQQTLRAGTGDAATHRKTTLGDGHGRLTLTHLFARMTMGVLLCECGRVFSRFTVAGFLELQSFSIKVIERI